MGENNARKVLIRIDDIKGFRNVEISLRKPLMYNYAGLRIMNVRKIR